ncbi:MAG: DUF3579 domain-containing protein [Betaproteobacteria bacterium]|nr:DUF3579 domain-containing protein [Betaproteobacteria bacterium]
MNAISPGILIRGITRTHELFRPSNWAHRLCGALSTLDAQKHLGYSPYLKPVLENDVWCVWLLHRLRDVDTRAYRFVLDFAKDNDLESVELTVPSDLLIPS